jgi:hypothetical protein
VQQFWQHDSPRTVISVLRACGDCPDDRVAEIVDTKPASLKMRAMRLAQVRLQFWFGLRFHSSALAGVSGFSGTSAPTGLTAGAIRQRFAGLRLHRQESERPNPRKSSRPTGRRTSITRRFCKDAYTRRGALEGMGEHLQGELLDPDVFERVEKTLGNGFESAAQRLPITYSQKLGHELTAIVQEAFAEGLPPQATDRIVAQATSVNNGFISKNNGSAVMPGKNYQAATRHGTPLQRAIDDPDPNVAYYALRIRTALDDAMEEMVDTAVKNAFSRGTPTGPARAKAVELAQALEDLKETRRRWYNMIVLKKAVSGPGEAAAEGTLSPQKLRQVLTSTADAKLSYAAGRGGGLQELARAGNSVLTPLPSSGTTQRSQATSLDLVTPARGIAGRIVNSPGVQARLKQRRVVPIQQAVPSATWPLVRGGVAGDPLAASDDQDALSPADALAR